MSNGHRSPPAKKPSPITIASLRVAADALPARPRVPTGDYQRKTLPFQGGSFPVPLEMSDQQGFIDTLVTLAGKPGSLRAEAFPSAYTAGNFSPRGQRITLSGMVMDAGLGASPQNIQDTRWTAAHEWGHLLAHNDDEILRAFTAAAPLPKRLLDAPPAFAELWNLAYKGGKRVEDTTRTGGGMRDYVVGEAFADMFASALGKQIPEMSVPENRRYGMTKQFEGASRRRMVDSLVTTLMSRLKL